MAICPNCGNQTGEGAIFCDQCGTRLPVAEAAVPPPAPLPASGSVICPACGAGNVPGEAFCDFCGSPLEAPLPAEPVPQPEAVATEAELQTFQQAADMEAEGAPPVPPPEEAVPPAAGASVPVAAGIAAPGELTCPVCGAVVQPDEAFCSNCGASLAQAPIPPGPVAEVEEAAPPLPVAPAAPEPLRCPVCGAEVEVDDTFCSNCGAALKAAPAAAPAPVVVGAPAAAGPRLLVVASGAEIPLPAGPEILIGREDPVSGIYPEVDLTPHGGEDGGVSRKHARLIVDGGQYFVEDLDSTNFTFVNKQKLVPETRQAVHDGDEIRCGRVALVLKVA
jgi:predicted amidophosphoribosyltransferase